MPSVPAFSTEMSYCDRPIVPSARLPGAGHLEVAVDLLVAERLDHLLRLRVFGLRQVGGEAFRPRR